MKTRDQDGTSITTYVPDEKTGGILATAMLAANELAFSREVLWRMFRRDFALQFRQRVLGYLWAVLNPLLGIASFLFMYYAGLLNPGVSGVPYPVYVFLGTSLWGFMTGPMNAISSGLQSQSELLLRTNIPKITLAVSSLATVLYGLVINIATIALLMLVLHHPPTWWLILYPVLALPMVVIGMGIGLITSVVAVIAKDTTPILNQVFALLMYATPVIYVSGQIQQPVLRSVLLVDPLTYLIDLPRSLVIFGHADHWHLYWAVALLACAFFVVCLKVFYLVNDLVVERL